MRNAMSNAMPNERLQFVILYRDFLRRIVDLEILSASGDIRKLLIQIVAILAAFNFVLAVTIARQYSASRLPHAKLLIAAWGDEEFLIASTMAVAGLFAVLAWNTVLPDRRDTLVLGLLPIRARTMLAARVASIATSLGVGVLAINVFTGLICPFMLIPGQETLLGGLRSFAAYWVAMTAAALFIVCSLLAVQGTASLLLSYRQFLRLSSFLQLTALFAILAVYFLTPPLYIAAHRHLLPWLPSFWFLGLFQELNGAADARFLPLAALALRNLSIAFAAAAISYGVAYYRTSRRIVELPDLAPAGRTRPAMHIARFLASRLLRKPHDQAIVLFAARTIARSRQHRLLLAAYAGAGLAIALAYAKTYLYESPHRHWNELNTPFLVGSLVMLFLPVVGARAAFAVPLALRSNWIFRIAAVHPPASYFSAVRKALYALTAIPIWTVSAVFYLSIWPVRPALEHLAVLSVLGVLIVECALYRFRKIPFTCSYLPGKSNLNVRLGAFAIAFLFAADQGVEIEFWVMQRIARYLVFLGILIAAAAWARYRTSSFARSEEQDLHFDDVAPPQILALDLHPSS